MSQAVIHVFYGLPLSKTTSGEKNGRTDQLSQLIENGEAGFFSSYSSNAITSTPAGFGIKLNTYYTGDHHSELGELANKQLETQYAKLCGALIPHAQELLKKFGKPRPFLLWSTD